METLSLHLCFQINEDTETKQTLLAIPGVCINLIGSPTCLDMDNDDKLVVATGKDGSHIVMRIYKDGLVTLDIQFRGTHPADKLTVPESKDVESRIKDALGDACLFTRSLPTPLKRGLICPYFDLGDRTLYEYGHLELLLEKDSQWQNIKIYKTRDFGNMLVLDDVIMVSEASDIYTQTLLGTERNTFADKNVLVLGGGDGGILNELLKLAPKHVLMAEIDIEVIKACRTHMRSVCGECMDTLVGNNYKIQIDNCLDVLKTSLEQKRTFDYVINNLSEYIHSADGKWYMLDETHNFNTSATILECSMKILNPGGKYLSRGDVVSSKEALSSFVNDITSIGLQYQQFIIDVPSFKEKYCLFEVNRPDSNGIKTVKTTVQSTQMLSPS